MDWERAKDVRLFERLVYLAMKVPSYSGAIEKILKYWPNGEKFDFWVDLADLGWAGCTILNLLEGCRDWLKSNRWLYDGELNIGVMCWYLTTDEVFRLLGEEPVFGEKFKFLSGV